MAYDLVLSNTSTFAASGKYGKSMTIKRRADCGWHLPNLHEPQDPQV